MIPIKAWCMIHIILLVLFIPLNSFSQELDVIYPPRETDFDTRDNDVVELLKLILERTMKTDGPFKMRPAIRMNEKRYTQCLKEGRDITVIWTSVTKGLEKELLPIRIPIRKGILGYRIFLIKKQNQLNFDRISTLNELKKLTVGQGHFWNDVKIFKTNGFKVTTGSSYEGLFEMLVNARFDFFSRGFNEAPTEWDARKNKLSDLYIEKRLLLYYPWPKFFYVSPHNTEFADRIERGFKMLIADGTHEQWFLKHNRTAIERANLRNRLLFKLENTLLPPTVPLEKKELWYDPFQ